MMFSVSPATTALSASFASGQNVPFPSCTVVKPATPPFRTHVNTAQPGDSLTLSNSSQNSGDNQANAPTFCQQHADTANELAHASRHLMMDQLRELSELLPNLKDALPSVSQMASVWWRNSNPTSCRTPGGKGTGLETSLPMPSEESGREVARAVVNDVAHQASRFVL
jgi:hypothetical protein